MTAPVFAIWMWGPSIRNLPRLGDRRSAAPRSAAACLPGAPEIQPGQLGRVGRSPRPCRIERESTLSSGRSGGRSMAKQPSKGLADVVAAATALSDIDGRIGRLSYRGYDIHQL